LAGADAVHDPGRVPDAGPAAAPACCVSANDCKRRIAGVGCSPPDAGCAGLLQHSASGGVAMARMTPSPVSLFLALIALACAGTAAAAQDTAPKTSRPKCAANETFDVHTGSCHSDSHTAELKSQKDRQYLVMPRKIPKSGTAYDLYLVETRDEIYVPVGVRKPAGKGPFPAVLVGSGNGVGGYTRIENALYRLEPMMDEMLKRGYVVAFANYRNEIPEAYNSANRAKNMEDTISGGARVLKSTATLDSDDYISLIEQLQNLPFVRHDDVGTIGVSHSGELQAKAASQVTWGGGVLIEGASYEFLAVDTSKAPRKDGVMQLQ